MRNYGINELNISITKVANGWIVTLPDEEPQMMLSGSNDIVDWTNPNYVKKVVNVMKEEYAKDPLLEDLGHYDKEPEPVARKSNIYIFPGFDAAIAFIKGLYDN